MKTRAAEAQWTPDRVRSRVAELGKWFHNINLKGVQTAPDHFLGDYPAFKWRTFEKSIPADLHGRTVLDVGCNAGFYSLEMKKRGADLVVAIDYDDEYLAQARFAAEVNGVEIDFRRMSVYEVGKLGRKFDLVLFMGVAYHLRHPLLALDLLHEYAVGDMFVFQSLLRGSPVADRVDPDYPFSETAVFDREGYPRLHFVEERYANDPTNWWIPNLACAEAMLRSSGFAILDHPEQEVFVCKRVETSDWARRASAELLRSLKGTSR
ncbi:MAG: TIGR04290 family methyltransferase [Acidobacteriia bacterium]|nr:TIGR04290 family methyltransferase [Terriglobia bacterium]